MTDPKDFNSGKDFSLQLGKIYDDFFNYNQSIPDKKSIPEEADLNNTTPITPEDALAKLNDLVGLPTVKKQIESLVNVLKIEKIRKERGLYIPEKSLHMVFSGNPGTGKTSVARILAEIYKALGVLQKGHLIEVERSGLVAGFVGQTSLKTLEVCKRAMDGVLFIDEAYSLGEGGENDFGKEAIQTLLKFMEDHRSRIIVIVAGYTKNMQNFLSTNPGLESRFNTFIEFIDYQPEELFEILERLVKKSNLTLSDEARSISLNIIKDFYNIRSTKFGNARFVRNLFEKAYVNQANRLAGSTELDEKSLSLLTSEDFSKIKNF